jgi:hypothetical protein
MQVKLGDFVRFVDENIEGYVTRIIDKDMIGVTDANDFEIPVQASKVTLVHGDIPDENGAPAKKTTAAVPVAEFKKDGVFLGLVSDQHTTSVAHFHLVNESSFDVLVAFTIERGGQFKGEFAGLVAGNAAKKIYSANMTDIQIWPKFRIEVLFHTSSDVEPKSAVLFNQSIKGKDLSVAKQDIPLLKNKGWLIQLDSKELPMDLNKLKERFQ